MEMSIGIAFVVSLLVNVAASWLFQKAITARLYSLECDVADLQDKHLRSIRKAAADKRWGTEEAVDEALADAVHGAETPKPKGWTKWGSSKSSN